MLEPEVKRKLSASVSRFYEIAGEAFASTRHGYWGAMDLLIKQIKPGDTVVDVGSGNGRLGDFLPPEVKYLGIEPSSSLRQASKHPLIAGSLPHLDLPDGYADAVACLAVLHHIPSQDERKFSVVEMHRILKPGGLLLCTVWNLRARRFLSWRTFKSAWLRLPGFKGGESGDVLYPWRAESRNEGRYVHAFTMGEFRNLFDPTHWTVESIGAYDKNGWLHWSKGRNLVAVCRKKR